MNLDEINQIIGEKDFSQANGYIHKIYTSIDDLDPDYDAILLQIRPVVIFPVFFNFNT